jgi:hypothetical protein
MNKLILKELNIRINFAYILLFVLFWSYGYFNPLIKEKFGSQPIDYFLLVYFTVISFYFYYLGTKKKYLFLIEYKISYKEILLIIFISIFWIIVSFNKLTSSLVGDQFYYSSRSKSYEINAIFLFNKYLNIENLVFKDLIYFIDILILISCVFFIWILFKLQKIRFLVPFLVSFLIIIFRVFSHKIGNGSGHAPLQLLPIWLSSSLFNLSDFSFRFPQLVGLILCTLISIKFLIKFYGLFVSTFAGLALCSIPVLIHVASLNEASIWTTTIWVIVLFTMISNNNISFKGWITLSSLISIFVLIRITSFLIFPIFISFFLLRNLHKVKQNLILIWIVLSPFLICLPYLLYSFIVGTPASYVQGEADYIINDSFILSRISYAIFNGTIFTTILSSVNNIYIVLILGLFLKYPNERNYFLNRFLIIFLLLLSVLMFYSIRPVLWGTDRYKAEFIIPFLILGGFLFVIYIKNLKFSKLLVLFFSFSLLIYGIISFNKYPYNIKDFNENNKFSRISENIYDYRSGLFEAKKEGFANNTMYLGVTYGILPYILAGYSISEVLNSKNILKEHFNSNNWLHYDANRINNDLNIKLLLLSDIPDSEEIANTLLENGWKKWRKFDGKGKSKIIGLIRFNNN